MRIFLKMSLLWDGSYLGDFQDVIVRSFQCDKDEFCEYLFGDQTVFCYGRPSKDRFPLIVEAAKGLFGLHVRGCHFARIDGKLTVLYRLEQDSDRRLIYEIPSSALERSHYLRSCEHFRGAMQETIVFLDAFCLKSSNEASIRVRSLPEGYVPVAYNEGGHRATQIDNSRQSIIPRALLRKWFGEDIGYASVIDRMMQKFTDSTGSPATEFAPALEKIVRYYEPSYLWYPQFVKTRLSHLID